MIKSRSALPAASISCRRHATKRRHSNLMLSANAGDLTFQGFFLFKAFRFDGWDSERFCASPQCKVRNRAEKVRKRAESGEELGRVG
jgi:hypothetical protein